MGVRALGMAVPVPRTVAHHQRASGPGHRLRSAPTHLFTAPGYFCRAASTCSIEPALTHSTRASIFGRLDCYLVQDVRRCLKWQ